MREKAIDTFQSLFERAAIPVLHIEEVRLRRASVVLKNDPLDASVLDLADYLRQRFGTAIRLHHPASVRPEQALSDAAGRGLPAEAEEFHSTAELVGQVGLARSQMVLIPEPQDEAARVVDKDDLVRGTSPPVLLVRTPVEKPAQVFRRILHSLSGNFRQTRNFSYSFGLVEDDGEILLLHVIDAREIRDVRDALRVSADVDDKAEQEVLEQLRRHGERYLKAVVAASRTSPFEVRYRLEVGEIVPTVERELAVGEWGLLVVGRHEEGFSHISASDYQLMHRVRHVPVLAL